MQGSGGAEGVGDFGGGVEAVVDSEVEGCGQGLVGLRIVEFSQPPAHHAKLSTAVLIGWYPKGEVVGYVGYVLTRGANLGITR